MNDIEDVNIRLAFERWVYEEGRTAGASEGRRRGFDEGFDAGFAAALRGGDTVANGEPATGRRP